MQQEGVFGSLQAMSEAGTLAAVNPRELSRIMNEAGHSANNTQGVNPSSLTSILIPILNTMNEQGPAAWQGMEDSALRDWRKCINYITNDESDLIAFANGTTETTMKKLFTDARKLLSSKFEPFSKPKGKAPGAARDATTAPAQVPTPAQSSKGPPPMPKAMKAILHVPSGKQSSAAQPSNVEGTGRGNEANTEEEEETDWAGHQILQSLLGIDQSLKTLVKVAQNLEGSMKKGGSAQTKEESEDLKSPKLETVVQQYMKKLGYNAQADDWLTDIKLLPGEDARALLALNYEHPTLVPKNTAAGKPGERHAGLMEVFDTTNIRENKNGWENIRKAHTKGQLAQSLATNSEVPQTQIHTAMCRFFVPLYAAIDITAKSDRLELSFTDIFSVFHDYALRSTEALAVESFIRFMTRADRTIYTPDGEVWRPPFGKRKGQPHPVKEREDDKTEKPREPYVGKGAGNRGGKQAGRHQNDLSPLKTRVITAPQGVVCRWCGGPHYDNQCPQAYQQQQQQQQHPNPQFAPPMIIENEQEQQAVFKTISEMRKRGRHDS